MEKNEIGHVVIAILLLFVIAALPSVTRGDMLVMTQIFVFSFFVIGIPVIARKMMAYALDSDVEHRLWYVFRYGIKPGWHFPKELPFGLIVPVLFAVLGFVARVPMMIMTFLTYEARALKHRAAKRFGYYSYTEMTDWHHALIGVAGIVSVLLVSLIGYLTGLEALSKMAAYYAFWNMIPLSKLDGAQIFFGGRIVYSILVVITLIFVGYAIVL